MTHHLYFISCKAANAVKIGIAYHVESRHRDLQASCPLELTIEASVPFDGLKDEARRGARTAEMNLHSLFEPQRLHGEWFLLTGPLKELVAYIAKARNFDAVADEIARAQGHRLDRASRIAATDERRSLGHKLVGIALERVGL